MNVQFQIPSYDRENKQLTVNLLHELGYPKEQIVVGVDNSEQKEKYDAVIGDIATVVDCNSTNCAEARYALLKPVKPGEYVVTLDDDITAFSRYLDKRTLEPYKDKESFDGLLERCFDFAKKHNAYLWGGYPVVNPYFMKETIDLRNVTLATFMGVIAGPFNFNPEWKVKEDYEICLREMYAGLNCIRFNYIVAEATHHTPGGAMRQWSSGQDELFTKRLCKKFPQFIAPSKNASGFTFKGLVKHKGEIV